MQKVQATLVLVCLVEEAGNTLWPRDWLVGQERLASLLLVGKEQGNTFRPRVSLECSEGLEEIRTTKPDWTKIYRPQPEEGREQVQQQ